MCTDVIQRVHYSGRPLDGPWSGWEEFRSVIFADDAIFVEAEIANISNETVAAWETSCRCLFGPDSINAEKVRSEGRWAATGLILGFDIDTEKSTIAVPPPKVEGARVYSPGGDFAVGSQHVTLIALQTIRGYMQHWLTSLVFRAICIQPVDLLLNYASEDSVNVSCANFQIWSGYWDMLSLIQLVTRGEIARPTLFQNSIERTVALHHRFPGPRVREEKRWLTTDAAPNVIGVVDWENRTFLRADAEHLMKFYVDKDGLTAGIAGKELMGLVLGSVAGFPAHPGAILFIGVDNLNAVYWVIKGKSRGKFARKLLSNFLLRCAYLGIGVIIFYLRTNHNVTADEITRVGEKNPEDWAFSED